MLEKLKNAVDKEKAFGAFLTDLPKASNCLSHELMFVKLNTYEFNAPPIKLMHSYLSNKKRLIKVNYTYSSWEETLF